MCKKTQFKYCPSTIDKCMRPIMKVFGDKRFPTRACCCGHGKYPMTLIMERDGKNFEFFSGKEIPRKKKFYKKDKQGYYYIPETLTNKELK